MMGAGAGARLVELCAFTVAGVALLCLPNAVCAQDANSGSLIVNPQQGATPRPLTPTAPLAPVSLVPAPLVPAPLVPAPLVPAPLVPAPDIVAPVIAPVQPQADPLLPLAPLPRAADIASDPVPTIMRRTDRAGALPVPIDNPLAIDPARDPVLLLARVSSSEAVFRAAIVGAVERNPGLGETLAQRDEAAAARNEARARQYPVVDLSLSHFEIVSRAFSNDPQNILERSRPERRTDATVRVQQAVFDFGAIDSRIKAGNQRLQAAVAQIEGSSAQIALNAISAWYNVYGYRALVGLAEAFAANQTEVRNQMQQRIVSGVAARGDMAQVDSYIASANAQVAQFRRSLASAEAQYEQLIGSPAPVGLARAPEPGLAVLNAASPAHDTDHLPEVRVARALAAAAAQEARGVRADILPSLSAGLDSGRYGVVENARDYDVRASVTLNLRLFGGAQQRADQAAARSNSAAARFRRTREEARRDAEIARSDVAALVESQAAMEANYIASRQSRDVLAERFRVSRGSLFDVLGAEGNYFGVAARYIQTVTELDIARYVLLARTGKLLDAVGINFQHLSSR